MVAKKQFLGKGQGSALEKAARFVGSTVSRAC